MSNWKFVLQDLMSSTYACHVSTIIVYINKYNN